LVIGTTRQTPRSYWTTGLRGAHLHRARNRISIDVPQSQVIIIESTLSRDDVLHQNQLQLSGRCRLRPSVVPMSAELGQDIGQEADGALPRDPKDKIEVLAEGRSGLNPLSSSMSDFLTITEVKTKPSSPGGRHDIVRLVPYRCFRTLRSRPVHLHVRPMRPQTASVVRPRLWHGTRYGTARHHRPSSLLAVG